jgi:hypothetical protein
MKTKAVFELTGMAYNSPTPRQYRRIGDAFLIAIPVLEGYITASPFQPATKLWLNFSIGLVFVTAKFVTNFFRHSEE